jgi:hypothetical protein
MKTYPPPSPATCPATDRRGIASALVLATTVTWVIRRRGLNDLYGLPIEITDKAPGWKRYLYGGILFGLGWALAETFAYLVLRERLPH